jgi:HK97 family phage major capsid protein
MPTVDKSRLKELNSALQAKATQIEDIATSWKIEDGNVTISTEQATAYEKAITEAEQIQRMITLEEKAGGTFDFLNQPAGDAPTAATEQAQQAAGMMATKSLSERFLHSDEWEEMKASRFRQVGAVASFDGRLEGKDIYSSMAGTIPNINALGHPQDLGWTTRMLRPGRVRDLFPAETTTANVLYGIRQTGYTNNAAVVPERTAADGVSPATGGPTDVYGLKPKSDLALTPVTYPLATIAHIMYVHKQTLADEPRMRGLIDRELVDGIKMVEDEQILYGDGVGDNLTGIINTPGIQTYTGANTDPLTAQIRRAITKATLAYFNPSGVVIHPLDWEDLELEMTEDGHYRLVMNIAIGAEQRMWRLDVVATPAMNEGQYLLGAFGYGAKLYDREQINIAVSTENRDMFERNAITLRCEERLGLVVDRPESFVVGAFTTPA